MSTIEWVAALFGFLAVVLTIARSRWCWPTGLVQVALYIVVFLQAKLYSDMLLHVIYVGLQIYGWQQWSKESATESPTVGRIIVKPISGPGLAGCVTLTVVATGGWGLVMSRYTDAAFPFGDAFTTVASLVAQVLLARRYLANWYFWIVVDVVAVAIYWQKGLMPTTILYAVFLVLATIGLLKWQQVLARSESTTELDFQGN